MRILVIGGAGYIGSHVVRELLDNDFSVTVFDDLSSGSYDNLFKEAQFVKGNILDNASLRSVITRGYDCVMHFAALKAAGESMVIPQKYAYHNINGTINILNAIVESGIKRFIFSSSAAVYGDPSYLPIDENHPTNPTNFYGFTKLEIERILSWYDRLCGITYACLRYFNAAGYDSRKRIPGLEKNPQNLIPCVMEAATGKRKELFIFGDDYPTHDGTGIRDYIHVSDLASGHLAAIDYISRQSRSLIVNLGSQTGISVQSIVDKARSITGKKIPTHISGRRDGDCAALYASSSKANSLLGWKPRFSDLETILLTTWEMYRKL